MNSLDQGSLRYHVLESAKRFKTSWIELGRALYSVWKDKHYKEWGYAEFQTYIAREIGIRKQTAGKLLRSYSFLEKEEPEYLKEEFMDSRQAAQVPAYEAIDLLRRAKNKKGLAREDYENLKKEIFESGKDAGEARKELTSLIRQREELEPEEAQNKRRLATVRRLLSALKALKNEAELLKLLPAPLIKEVAGLIQKLEAEISDVPREN